jgi:hypothetical protein
LVIDGGKLRATSQPWQRCRSPADTLAAGAGAVLLTEESQDEPDFSPVDLVAGTSTALVRRARAASPARAEVLLTLVGTLLHRAGST